MRRKSSSALSELVGAGAADGARAILRHALGMGMVVLASVGAAPAVEPAVVKPVAKTMWTLQNDALRLTVQFRQGCLAVTSFENRTAGIDYLQDRAGAPLFAHVVNGVAIDAADGQWELADAAITDIQVGGRHWGRRLELTVRRAQPIAFRVRQIFELYDGRGGIRCSSFLRNDTAEEVVIGASDVLRLRLPDAPHTLYHIEGVLTWRQTRAGLANGGRNALACYDSGDGWFVLPENNWATCLEAGAAKAHSADKLLGISVWDSQPDVRVATNPKAVQLVLFPREEVEYFAVNLGVFKGDVLDGRVAAAEHLRQRYAFQDGSHELSVNDWQWGALGGRRTDENYRRVVIPKARAAGLDRIHIDDFWYEPEDGVDPKGKWTDMPALCDCIVTNGMKPGHWFSLQGRICVHGWGDGRDCADPQNVDFKLRQMEETLIGRYHSQWDQVDAGLLWKTDAVTAYSHPSDSVYRKILGLRRYMNTIAHAHPGFIMQTTCEVDNPAGPGAADSHGNQSVGLIHLADNGIAGMFRRTEYRDDVRDLFAAVGMFPLEGMLSTWGEDGNADAAWKDSPLWYYQFLLARHTSLYSWPGNWSDESVTHLRLFNDWRKNPRFRSVLRELMRPVYNGQDWLRNEGPWAWMFVDAERDKALLFAVNHLALSRENQFAAKLRWLDPKKFYLVEEITQLPGGRFACVFRGRHGGQELSARGLEVDLERWRAPGLGELRPEPCAAFWIQAELPADGPQVVYADAAVSSYIESRRRRQTCVELKGEPGATATLAVFDPALAAAETVTVKLDGSGRGSIKLRRKTQD